MPRHTSGNFVNQIHDRDAQQHASNYIDKTDFAQSIRCGESLGMGHDLKDGTATPKRLDVGTPSQPGEKKPADEEQIARYQEYEPHR